ncbi:MAG TPA: M50 family metallopeptidase [Candidatus Saccharimonadales bacterium]|nr:M50 family metallopeptidase [Candidatus Saccharimonadales bacterium]
MLLLIIGLILFVGLVVIHEFGHFIMARRNGVEIEEFGIGFPPKVWKKRIKSPKGDYDFTINLLPLGGFVRLKGENDAASAKGTFGAASLWAKTQIMAAGVVMNLITALVLLTILAVIGLPRLIENQFTVPSDTKITPATVAVATVEDGSPADRAGLREGDVIRAIGPAGNQTALEAPRDLRGLTSRYAGQQVQVRYERGGQTRQATVDLRDEQEVAASLKTNNPKGYLGVSPDPASIATQRSTWSAPIVALGLTGQLTKLTFEGLGRAVAGLGSLIAGAATGNSEARSNGQRQASEQVSGPLGIFFILKEGGVLGYQFMLFIIAVISLTLAIMNILPIPALDGGRLWLTLLTHGIGKPLSKEKEELINGIGFLFLMVLIVLITIVDIKRFF